MGRAEHWEGVYRSKGDTELSWFQARAGMSLELIGEIRPRARRVIDVGGGQSGLAGELAGMGMEVAVLDISPSAIERARSRLGEREGRVRWIVGDVLGGESWGEFDVWHDRAVFHFLTEADERRAYVEAVERSVPAGGRVVLGAFGPRGPERCSGLPVRRWDAAGLASEFGGRWRLEREAAESHVTTWGKVQEFCWVVMVRG